METFTIEQMSAFDVINGLAPTFDDAEEHRQLSEALTDCATDKAIQAAIACATWETLGPVFERIEQRIRDDVDGEARRWSAKLGKGAEIDEQTGELVSGHYTVPHTVSHLKSQLKRAFENGVPLTDETGAARSFNEIRKDNAAVSKAAKAAAQADAQAAAAVAVGLDLREYGMTQVAMLRELVLQAADGAALAELVSAIESVVSRYTPDVSIDADEPVDVADAMAA